MPFHIAYYPSPIGLLELKASATHLVGIRVVDAMEKEYNESSAIIDICRRQLILYFANQLSEFTIPVHFSENSSSFNSKVWQALMTIPYGSTVSYQKIATIIEHPHSERAIGNACRKNPLLVVFPCHRVVRTDGKLGGYVAGIEAKQYLLNMEQIKKS